MKNDNHVKMRKMCVVALSVCFFPLIFLGCTEEVDEWKYLAFSFRVRGGTNVNIDYIDESGTTKNISGIDLSADQWEIVSMVPFGATLYLSATDLSGGQVFLDVFVDDDQVANSGGSTSAWISYNVPYVRPPRAKTNKVLVEYRVLGNGTNVQIGWYNADNADGVEHNFFYNLNANADQWDVSFIANSGSSLGLRAYSGSDEIHIFLDNEQVVEASGGSGRWSSYIVP